ncbi:DUF3887 domain-containing protein [Cyanobium sp. CH-040]|uniref:DUF3887 domain-containing protein n=1 Tax=Cyanobium sp. CH-040 TaxID=2823708 RepID=UPI0020CE43B2|nr:DUF3887 domain-containing protein [Cyanobium sp. CH-040]MCP9928077.1 DUF3887 domain-containing protein [Cyanobium sp. CH-040]
MPRSAPLLLGLCAALTLGGAPQGLRAQGTQAAAAPRSTLTVAEARAAANRFLEAAKTRDADLRYAQFSPELKAISSPAIVAERIRNEPVLRGWTLLSVRGGLSTTTVEATLDTAEGTRDLFMVLNGRGELEGYHFDLTDADTAKVARDFVVALSAGQFVTARSFLSLPKQEEFSAAALRTKWQELQRQTGAFVKVGRVLEVDRAEDTRLVLVSTEFREVTDALFVILNTNNEIVAVNFPQDPVRPRKFSPSSR